MIKKYQASIYVTLRNSVLDPAGVAVESGLKQLGYESDVYLEDRLDPETFFNSPP
ncbi:phosphoribosylformylglycinamidine synthase subunit PurS, partial [Moorena sp. SIO2C4]|uniref:phosphoribosylformylglycinamidine synthase subunit PurS n=1 Tax=Moorena sp. SIO2C4 TaxID=2607824 RepID=UPI0013CB593C